MVCATNHFVRLQAFPVSGNLADVRRQLWLVIVICSLAFAQQTKEKDKKESPPKKDEPIPLFSGKIGTKSSQKTKESATLGFNGIDPSGKVDQQMLATPATSDHEAKVKKMAELAPTPAELDTFVKEGGLKKQ
jgi:hypothetical protein